MHSNGFPNCFIMGNTQTAFTANYPHALNEQSIHLAHIVNQCLSGNHKVVEALPEAEQAWVEQIVELARVNIGYLESCTPGYYNNEGKPLERALQNSNYGAGPVKFFELMQAWREEGQLEGLKLS
jgi:cyclohexanone monooxygenase